MVLCSKPWIIMEKRRVFPNLRFPRKINFVEMALAEIKYRRSNDRNVIIEPQSEASSVDTLLWSSESHRLISALSASRFAFAFSSRIHHNIH
jgi:hypothetical protein